MYNTNKNKTNILGSLSSRLCCFSFISRRNNDYKSINHKNEKKS